MADIHFSYPVGEPADGAEKTATATTAIRAQRIRLDAAPGWVRGLLIALVIYVAIGATWMVTGFGGEKVIRYVGLFADAPANLISVIIAFVAARHLHRGALRTAWIWLSIALAQYLVGNVIAITGWLHNHDPFPGIADIFYS